MKLANTPDTPGTSWQGDLDKYRAALQLGECQCGVADIESIFRLGFPLGSSTFKKIFGLFNLADAYETLATYEQTVQGLDMLRALATYLGPENVPGLEKLLAQYNLQEIPNPGFVLKEPVYDTTTKFEATGDRFIGLEEERRLSGLCDEGYDKWKNDVFPRLARAQIRYCKERGILNIDGKGEAVTYKGWPVVTDFCCTVDENREMIIVEIDGEPWAIPSNKEIQRAIFREMGVYSAIADAKRIAESEGQSDLWRDKFFPEIVMHKMIDLQAVTEHSCNLMAYAIAEVANRTLGKTVFNTPPINSWTQDFKPYASKIQYQE
jgi:hypothetical protein